MKVQNDREVIRRIGLRVSSFHNRDQVMHVLATHGFLVRHPFDVVGVARECLGAGYLLGAHMDDAPAIFDCSGLTKWLYEQAGIWIPRVTYEQWHMGRSVDDHATLRPGDLLFWKGSKPWRDQWCPDGIGHVGICVEVLLEPDGFVRMIHAANEACGVVEETVTVHSRGWRGAVRIVEDFDDLLIIEMMPAVAKALQRRLLRPEAFEKWLRESIPQ